MKITKKAIRETLAESVFNPSEKNPFSVVVALSDPSYAELKAIELITDARAYFKAGAVVTYHDIMQQVIGLLALARVQRGSVSG